MNRVTPPLPPEGLSTSVKVSRVIDGDTIEVTLERKFNVRLLNYSRPELGTAEGQQFKKELEVQLKAGDIVHLFIPAFRADRLVDNTTFNRVLAYVYDKDGMPV